MHLPATIAVAGLLALACSQPVGTRPGTTPNLPEPPVTPPTTPTADPIPGLLSIVPGDREAMVRLQPGNNDLETALFSGTDRNTLFATSPLVVTDATVTVSSLVNGVDLYFGLAVRDAGSADPLTPSGPVLTVRPGAPILVDAAADPNVADGLSPATAFADIAPALSLAASRGGGNVWVRGGEYTAATYFATTNVHVYGGFAAGFDLADRDPQSEVTTIEAAGGTLLSVTSTGLPGNVVIDGVVLDGAGVAAIAIDASDTPIELRGVTATHCLDRGFRLRSASPITPLSAVITDSVFSQNGADGVSAAGGLDLHVFHSTFDSNQQEGLDVDDLVALDGQVATAHIVESRFFGNGAEGIDMDLAAPLFPGLGGGRFDVVLRGCRFVSNRAAGLLVDLEYDLLPGYSGSTVIDGCVANDNGGAGIHIDADGPGDAILHRVSANANGGDGVLITSESDPGLVLLSSSAMLGNLGAGARARLGNKAILATHCVFAGNVAGGLVSDLIESGATSSIAHLQDQPWSGARAFASLAIDDPAAPLFVRAPIAYDAVLSATGPALTLAAGMVVAGATVELGDDGLARFAQQVTGTSLLINEAPSVLRLPASLSVFDTGASVREDLHLDPGSTAIGAGMTAPGATPVDAGVHGSPTGGDAGVATAVARDLFRIRSVTPALQVGAGSGDTIVIEFGATVDDDAVAGNVRAVATDGTVLAAAVSVDDTRVQVAPPAGGWPTGAFAIEVHAGLRNNDGTPLTTPVALPLRSR